MTTQEAYNVWAAQYDTNNNKTRDTEAQALRETLRDISFATCLEIGCGTGKNTEWLITKADTVTAVDLSEEMLAKAKAKIRDNKVRFIQADITKSWAFASENYDLITFSLVLEHIENLEPVFEKTSALLKPEGYVYVGELHPFKQYTGTKARFDTEQGVQVVPCFNHHISDFIKAAKKYGLSNSFDLKEYFDEDNEIPRVMVLIMQKIN